MRGLVEAVVRSSGAGQVRRGVRPARAERSLGPAVASGAARRASVQPASGSSARAAPVPSRSSARCAAERSLFLQPFVEALGPALAALAPDTLRALAGRRAAVLADLLPDLADLLGGTEPVRVSPDAQQRRAFKAVTAMLAGLAAQRPLLLVVDDLHNGGHSGVALLHYLGRRAGPACSWSRRCGRRRARTRSRHWRR